MAALALSAGRFPFSARYSAVGEMNAVPVMLAAQICAAALLHPWMFGRCGAAAIWALAMLMLQLAAYLAGVGWQNMLWPAGYVSAWLGILCLAACWYPGERCVRVGVALAGWLSIGGPVLWYLRAEFIRGGVIGPGETFGRWFPVPGAISLSVPNSSHAIMAWVGLAVPLLGVIGLALAKRVLKNNP